MCPSPADSPWRRENCGTSADLYCAKWGCEEYSTSWKPISSGLIQFTRDPKYDNCPYTINSDLPQRPITQPCNQLLLSFTKEGKSYPNWLQGRNFGLRQWMAGRHGGIIHLRLLLSDIAPRTIGPNPLSLVTTKAPQKARALKPPIAPALKSNQIMRSSQKPQSDPLWELMLNTYVALNGTRPDIVESCWLCYDSRPPFYEAVAVTNNYTLATDMTSCRWQPPPQARLTLQLVSGSGTCVGTVPDTHQSHCSQTFTLGVGMDQYLVPPNNSWWACSSGLTPCTYGKLLSDSYCVLVQLVPRLIYHNNEEFLTALDRPYQNHVRNKRELISATVVTLAVLLGAAGAGTGITSLVIQDKYYGQLRQSIDLDIQRLEESIADLEQSVESLAEVVLQNRRGLNLVFLEHGGLCATLREECCFYVNKSGVIRESLAKVREGLEQRRKEREARTGWFESWFSTSPWWTTLLSTLLGPLTVIILILTVGPCLLNKLMTYIRQRLGTIQLMVLRSQYQHLATAEDSTNV